MKKLIQIIIFTGLIFLSFASKTEAASVAGESAGLSVAFRADKRALTNATDFKKRLAIKAVLEKYNSPMADSIDGFIATAKKYDLDYYLLPSITGLESTFGRFIYPESYNPFGWGGGYIMFDSWNEGIDAVGRGLRLNYVNKGANTIEKIGPIYSESETWAVRVNWFMKEFQKEEEKLSSYTESIPVLL